MQSNLTVYSLGATKLVFAANAVMNFVPPANCNGFYITGYGQSTFIGGQSIAGSTIVANGILAPAVGTVINGPATFYMSAAGTTNTINLVTTFSDKV